MNDKHMNDKHNPNELQLIDNQSVDDDIQKWIPIYQDLHMKLDSILSKIKARRAKKK